MTTFLIILMLFFSLAGVISIFMGLDILEKCIMEGSDTWGYTLGLILFILGFLFIYLGLQLL